MKILLQYSASGQQEELKDLTTQQLLHIRNAVEAHLEARGHLDDSKWIPTSERFPEDRTRVLFYGFDAIGAGVFTGTFIKEVVNKTEKLENVFWGGPYRKLEITHWQPYPAPPEE